MSIIVIVVLIQHRLKIIDLKFQFLYEVFSLMD
jgi:hypothetical protein